jgi:hypothetical protein
MTVRNFHRQYRSPPPIRLHDVVLSLKRHRDNFTFYLLYQHICATDFKHPVQHSIQLWILDISRFHGENGTIPVINTSLIWKPLIIVWYLRTSTGYSHYRNFNITVKGLNVHALGHRAG